MVDVRARHDRKGRRCGRATAEKSPRRDTGVIWLPLPPSAGGGLPASLSCSNVVEQGGGKI